MTNGQFIELEGVRVNNLRSVNVRIRRNTLTVICGVSGSGKSSLAFDTLAAEGQRRYIETFSPSARQFLDRIERPAADRMTGLPPAIALRQQTRSDGLRSTFGTRTEVIEPLRVLLAAVGDVVCSTCGNVVRTWTPDAAADHVLRSPNGSRVMITAAFRPTEPVSVESLLRQGFTRAIVAGRSVSLESLAAEVMPGELRVVVDRLKAEPSARLRLAEAIAAAHKLGLGACEVLSELVEPGEQTVAVDGADWSVKSFPARRECVGCRQRFPDPTPELLSFTSPLGACPDCEGTGIVRPLKADEKSERASSSLASRARLTTACATCAGRRLNRSAECMQLRGQSLTKLCAMECGDLLDWLQDADRSLNEAQRVSVRAALDHLERRLKLIVDCGLSYLSLDRSSASLSGGESQRAGLVAATGCGLIHSLYVLDEPSAGLHAVDTDRVVTLVRQLQRAGNTVVVVEHDPAFLDEADDIIEIGPGAGAAGGMVVFQGTPDELRAIDSATGRMMAARAASGGREPCALASAPSALASGGREPTGTNTMNDGSVVPARWETTRNAASGGAATRRREPTQWLTLTGVTCHNIRDLSVRIPLGVLCAITGVSGSGKSSLVVDSLYPVLAKQRGQSEIETTGTISRLDGGEHIETVMLLDQHPVRRSRRSLPATWIGVFDEIRGLLADTHEARKRNASRALFSFNAKSGGRCPVCEGRGVVTVSMQFLADIETPCEDCQGRRFRPDVLEIRYRDRSVDDILKMTADEAFVFFNGHHRIQQRLNAMRQAGLGYLRLGQSLNTVSGGEAQRLRIAALLAGLPLVDGDVAADNRKSAQLTQAGRTLFLLDEPSTGLHAADLERLLSCFDYLLQTGHSIVAIDHDPVLLNAADWQIELGPGPGRLGGRIVSDGPVR